jgi:MinD-like ATPase involved in chromosome partitioning or flagellar assembly
MDPRISIDTDAGQPFIIKHPKSSASLSFKEIVQKIEKKIIK